MIQFCKYKDVFGAPNTGLHRYRIANIAIIDTISTLIVAYLISLYTKNYFKTGTIWGETSIVFLILMVLSIFIHKLFCVDTTLTMMVFGKD